MKSKTVSMFLALLVACTVCASSLAEGKHSTNTGLSAGQLRELADSLPASSGGVQAMLFFRRDVLWIDRVAILTQGESSGWQIFVFHVQDDGKLALEWKSGKLDDSFAVSSVDQFHAYDVDASEKALKFSGCGAHNCPDVFSVILYVPSKNQAFTATYILGKVTYSPASDGPDYQSYKTALDHFIAEHRSITN